MQKKHIFITFLIFFLLSKTAWGGRAPIQDVSAAPYASAILLDADTGETLFSENIDKQVYPASTLKLMVLLIILERVEQGNLSLDEMVPVTVEAYKMGGSQVYLDPKEQFPLEELLYALMIQSANDAAVALATHVSGSVEGFVDLMNQKAKELGMKDTHFHSVHGLPPASGQKVDVTTARDFALLCRSLSRHPEAFPYTSTRVREFRGGEFIMRTHNHLLEQVSGCDGFKTGFFQKAGFSIAATAKRDNVRIIAIVMGSKDRKMRDAKAIELLAKGFAMVPSRSKPLVSTTVTEPVKKKSGNSAAASDQAAMRPSQDISPGVATESGGWGKFFMGAVFGFILFALLNFLVLKRQRRGSWRSRRRF